MGALCWCNYCGKPLERCPFWERLSNGKGAASDDAREGAEYIADLGKRVRIRRGTPAYKVARIQSALGEMLVRTEVLSAQENDVFMPRWQMDRSQVKFISLKIRPQLWLKTRVPSY